VIGSEPDGSREERDGEEMRKRERKVIFMMLTEEGKKSNSTKIWDTTRDHRTVRDRRHLHEVNKNICSGSQFSIHRSVQLAAPKGKYISTE
jgi:hypothetical protein